MYAIEVWFSWDPAKSDQNLVERGFDFEFASRIFDGGTVEREDRRQDYGERRVVAMGRAEGIAIALVYTDRSLTDGWIERRIISARVSSRRERKAYDQATRQDPPSR